MCEGEPLPNGYPTECDAGWIETGATCTCKVFDCGSCNCSECGTIADCGRSSCAEIVPNGLLASIVTLSITLPLSFIINRLFAWFHKPHLDILEHEAPKVAASANAAGHRLKGQLTGARQRLSEQKRKKETVGELDLMLEGERSRSFKFYDSTASRIVERNEQLGRGAEDATELADLPPLDEGKVWYTYPSGLLAQMTKDEREAKLRELESEGRKRVGQLDDPASRPVVYFALPFGFACTVGIVSVVLIASALRQLTVQRTVEWLAASAASVGSESLGNPLPPVLPWPL